MVRRLMLPVDALSLRGTFMRLGRPGRRSHIAVFVGV